MNDVNIFLNVNDVMKICNVSQGKAYNIIRALNDELKEKGHYIVSGRVSKSYLYERLNIKQ